MGSFFQSGPQAAELLVDTVRRAAPELAGAGLVVDAYAGVGMFAVCATDPATRIVAVETSRSAVSDAAHNLAERDAEIVRGEVGGWRLPPDAVVDVVLADPARSGLGKPGVNALTRTGAPILVLVSCDPASLGRDARLLGEAGYRHDRSVVVDTFPHTTHIEAVSRFVRDADADRDRAAACRRRSPRRSTKAAQSWRWSRRSSPTSASRRRPTGEALDRCIAAIRDAGAVPAVTAVLDGVARVGIASGEHDRILGPARKAAERDLPVAIAQRWPFGATTVSGAAGARRGGAGSLCSPRVASAESTAAPTSRATSRPTSMPSPTTRSSR